MREVMRYVAATQRTASPLYLASFDMQAGQSRATGDRVFDQLFEALGRFSSTSVDAGRWRTVLLDASRCRDTYSRASTDSAIRGIARWIDEAAVAAARQRPAAHTAALRLVPRSLDQMARLCEAAIFPALRSHARSHAIRWPPATCSRCATAYRRRTRS